MPITNKTDIEIAGDCFIRTVTFAYTGRVVAVSDDWIQITDAAWIADTGRWSDAIATGSLQEVEPYPDGQNVLIARGGVIEVSEWNHG